MEVAEAVSASISYPIFFRPVSIGDSMFVDGGLVSNFPAWVLDDVRAEDTRAYPTFGFRLLDPPARVSEEPGLFVLVKKIMAATLDSRQSLESRQIDDYHPISLETHIRTLEFHLLKKEGATLVRAGQVGVERYFAEHIGPRDPEEMARALRALADLAQEVTFAQGIVRAYLIQRVPGEYACRVAYSALMEGDADDVLLIRLGTASQALSLQMKEPILVRVRDIPEQDRVQPATKYLHAMRPQNVSHVYCVPIFQAPTDWAVARPMDRAEPIAALCVDFTNIDDLLLLEPHVEDWMAALAQAAGEYWLDRVLTGIPQLPDPAPSPSPDWAHVMGATGYYQSERKLRGPLAADDDQKLEEMIRRLK